MAKHKRKRKAPSVRHICRWNQRNIDHIHERIRSGSKPTRKQLADELGISQRSVQRDINYLKLYKGLPLKVARKGGESGYYYDGPVSAKIGRTITEQELLNFIIADRAICALPTKQRRKKLGLGFDKLSQLLDDRTARTLDELNNAVYFRPFAPERIDMEVFVTLSEGVRRYYAVKFLYLKHMADEAEWKCVYPYCFTCAANSWYMIAYDPKAKEMRTYMLSRMEKPSLTNEKFKKPKNFSIEKYLDGALIIMKGNESHDVVVEFDRWAAAYVRNREIIKGQTIEEIPGGGLRISFHVTCLEEVEAWVAYWRQHAYVVSPPALQDRFHDYGAYLAQRYPTRSVPKPVQAAAVQNPTARVSKQSVPTASVSAADRSAA